MVSDPNSSAFPQLNGFGEQFLQAVLQADQTMQEGQLEAWADFYRDAEELSSYHPDTALGMHKGRLLQMQEISLRFHVQPKPTRFFDRVATAWNLVFRPSRARFSGFGEDMVIGKASQAGDVEVTMKVARNASGKLEVSTQTGAST